MSMSKKDYELLVDSLAETHATLLVEVDDVPTGVIDGVMTAVIANLCVTLKGDNDRFQPSSFRARYWAEVASLKGKFARKVVQR